MLPVNGGKLSKCRAARLSARCSFIHTALWFVEKSRLAVYAIGILSGSLSKGG